MSEIPDSISAETLQQLINSPKPLPGATQLPVLDFGGKLGGAADLQYVLCLIIQRSVEGVNVAQLLFAAMHLLNVAQSHFEATVERIDEDGPELEGIPPRDIKILQETMRSQAADVRDAIRAVDSVVSLLGPALSHQRAEKLARSLPKGAVMHSQEFFSRLLISDELIQSLGIERDSVSEFISEQLHSS